MCNRYTIKESPTIITKVYPFDIRGNYYPNYNLAPTDLGLVITADEPNVIQQMHFGLVPFWAKDKKIGATMLNAREEEVMDKKTYAPLVQKHKTCLVLADGFYEWDKKSGSPVPYYFSLKERLLFAFAGLWSQWKNGDDIYRSFTILTTESNDIVGQVHAPKLRMPVILHKQNEALWLNKEIGPSELLKVCEKYPDELMQCWQVSTKVNSSKADGEDLNKAI